MYLLYQVNCCKFIKNLETSRLLKLKKNLLKGFDCQERCEDKNDTLPLCTAATEPYLDLETHYENSIFSPDPLENPAFYDYNIGREKP